MNPNNPDDEVGDKDDDGLPNWLEFLLGTDPEHGCTLDTANRLELEGGAF